MCRTCFKQVALLIYIHSATLCNSLQHTSTHCHTLQHTDVPNVFQASRPADTLHGRPAGRMHLSISINLHILSQSITYIGMQAHFLYMNARPFPIYECKPISYIWMRGHFLYTNASPFPIDECEAISYTWMQAHFRYIWMQAHFLYMNASQFPIYECEAISYIWMSGMSPLPIFEWVMLHMDELWMSPVTYALV